LIQEFIAVLKIKFKDIGRGVKMIDQNEFAIDDSKTKCEVDLRYRWITCFTPGRRLEMSMVFTRTTPIANCCPNCGATSIVSEQRNVKW
jgi:hypothetical protein